jgi:carboxyl-terminal processing protease
MLRLLLCAVLAAASVRAATDLDAQMKSIIQAYSILEQNAADPVSSEQAFFQGAIPGLLRHLDPHSVFFDPGQFEQLKKMETSTQKGFGTVVSLLPGRVIVLQTLPGTPSAKSGLMPGDDILGVNGYVIAQLDTEQITQLLSQSRQNQVRLDVRRGDSPRILQFVLTPEEMQSPSVDRAFFIGAGIGYIRVTSFDGQTAVELKEAINKLGGDKLAGLVLDFRNNPGGMVTTALEMSSLFLTPGTKIVTVRGRHYPEKTEVVPSIANPYQFKLAILVNEKTASSSEIFAGAMQDHDRATIIGSSTFGKGLVQSVFPMSENTGLALTTALYYTPSGRSIQKPLDSEKFELGGATANTNPEKREFRTDKGRIVRGGGGIEPDLVVFPPNMTRFRAVLDASASFTSFATEYLRNNKITTDFEITSPVLGEFQIYLSQRRIQPSVGEWTREREFISNRLKTEIFNQAFGVAKGDEVEAERDPIIQKALEVVSQQ